MDCSEFVSWCYWNAGVKQDPSGNDWNDAYTRDMWENGEEVSLFDAKPGDLVFYDSSDTPSHVAMYIGKGEVLSKGNDDGPVKVPIGYRTDLKFIRRYL
jgi:peptidoglycan endopeptidase LytE